MLVVHHLENSRSQRLLFLLEEMGLDYEVKRYERDRKTSLAPAELKAVHPLGKSPMLEDDGKIYLETGAIFEHLMDKYDDGKLRPAVGSDAREQYNYWMHAAEGSIAALLVMKLVFTKTTQKPVPFFIRPVTKAVAGQINSSYLGPSIQAHLDLIEQTLTRQSWFAGDEFTAADVMMSFAAEGLAVRGDMSKSPKLADFLKRIHGRPAYLQALERGGPYDLMG